MRQSIEGRDPGVQSRAGQAVGEAAPSATFTPMISSSIVTNPSPLQSPRHGAAAAAGTPPQADSASATNRGMPQRIRAERAATSRCDRVTPYEITHSTMKVDSDRRDCAFPDLSAHRSRLGFRPTALSALPEAPPAPVRAAPVVPSSSCMLVRRARAYRATLLAAAPSWLVEVDGRRQLRCGPLRASRRVAVHCSWHPTVQWLR
jgi:hypothetical protein